MVDPSPPLVDQAGAYLSTRPISCLPLLFVSCDDRSHPVQASFLINMVRTFADAFNAEGTYLPWTSSTPYPHVGPILLASSSGGFLGEAFNEMLLFPLKSWNVEDRVILSCAPRHFGLSLFVLGKYLPRYRPWVLVKRGPNHKFSGPIVSIL